MMRIKRLVLLSNRSILTAGVQSLLHGVERFEVSTVEACDPEWAAKVKQLVPSVIVLDSGDKSLGEGVITRLLEEHPRARVIALNLNHTGIEVYKMKRVRETDFYGLLKAISGKESTAVIRQAQPSKDDRDQDGGDTRKRRRRHDPGNQAIGMQTKEEKA